MSDVYDSHLILHHLDDPLRILYWTMDEALVLLLPLFAGLGTGHPLVGFVCASIGFWCVKTVKKRFGLSTLRHALYWYFPHSRSKLPHTPPSYIREWMA